MTSDEEKLVVTSGTLSLEIGKKNWYMVYKRNGEVITKSAEIYLLRGKTAAAFFLQPASVTEYHVLSSIKGFGVYENRLEGRLLRQG